MSFIQSLLPESEPDVPMDDNAAQTDQSDNPFLAPTITAMRSGFDGLYDAVKYLVEGKRSALKQADKMIKEWEKKLQWIVDEYQKLLDKFDDVTGEFSASLTIDIAKETWEVLQEFPIFRRYLGEANYWLLYDTVGLAAYQLSSLGGDLASAVKEAIKAGIKALLAMTDGVMSLESYLGVITQWWGALYIKVIPYPLWDSIVPNVTCAYYYKPPMVSSNGVANPAPSLNSFIPIPIPIPDADYALAHGVTDFAMDYNDPTTWEGKSGDHKFANMEALRSALEHWGSSYTNATLPLVTSASDSIPAVYKRRDYVRDKERGSEAHPLRVGHSFAQLDTSKTEVAYSGTDGNKEDAVLKEFEALWDNAGFQEAMRKWAGAWDDARTYVADTVKAALAMNAPTVGADGSVLNSSTNFTSMKQIRPHSESSSDDARYTAFRKYEYALFATKEDGRTIATESDGSPAFKGEVYSKLDQIGTATLNLIRQYLLATGQDDGSDATTTRMPPRRYRLGKSRELAILLARAAAAMRAKVPASSTYRNTTATTPLLSASWELLNGWRLSYAHGLSHFARMLPTDSLPQPTPLEGDQWPEGLQFREFLGSDHSLVDPGTDWISIPAWGSDELDDKTSSAYLSAYYEFLVYPALQHPMPWLNYTFEDGRVVAYANDISAACDVIGEVDKGGLTDPRAWCDATDGTDDGVPYPTCGFFTSADVDKAPTTVVQALITMMDERSTLVDSLSEEIANEVGYAVLEGRRPLAACFDVYGRLLSMQGWNFQAMPTAALPTGSPTYNEASVPAMTFNSKYARIRKGSDLWYEIKNPKNVVYKHSSFYSPSMGMSYTIYHAPMEHKTYSRGGESYDFQIFPTESVSIQEIKEVAGDISLGNLRETFEGEDGRKWSFITMKNAVPKCPKYVDLDRWSFVDIVHELYLLAWGMSPLCGDNGNRMAKLNDILNDLGIKGMQFIGQLPENDGQYAEMEIGIFNDFADRIEKLVGSVYELRAKLLAATEAW